MQLYEFPPTRSIRVPFEAITVDLPAGEHRRPEFLKLNPAGKLPVLVDGDVVLTESVAIARYLAEKYAEKGFLPRDVAQRAQVDRWLLFAATELEQPLWRITRHTNLYPESERLPAEVAIAARDFREMAAVLEQHMQSREYVATDRVTVADFVMAYTLDWANEVKLLDECPRLRAYMERMYARPKAPLRIAAAFAQIGLNRPQIG